MADKEIPQGNKYGLGNFILTIILCVAAVASAAFSAVSAGLSKQASDAAENISERSLLLAATSYSPLLTATSKIQQAGTSNTYYDTLTIRNERGRVSGVFSSASTFIRVIVVKVAPEIKVYREIWLPILGYFGSFHPTGLTEGLICDPQSAYIPYDQFTVFRNDLVQSALRDHYQVTVWVVHCIALQYFNGYSTTVNPETHFFTVGESSTAPDIAANEQNYAYINTQYQGTNQENIQIITKENAFQALTVNYLDGARTWELCRDHLLVPINNK